MTHIFAWRHRITLLILVPLLLSNACSSSDPSTVPPADIVFGPGDFKLADTKAGLVALSSYVATLSYSFEGTRNGNPEHWSKTYVMLTRREPAARILTIETAGNIADVDSVFMAEADGAAYERLGENACTAKVIEQGNLLADWLEPAGLLTSVIGADVAEGDTINELAADHFTFDERALGASGIVQSTGEMWVASEGGYIVRYLLTTAGTADYFGEGIEGTLSWDYELTDVNQPVKIELPADCPAGMVNAPLLPDASNVLNVPGVLTYDTSSSLADAAAFYQEQISGLGWKLPSKPAITDTMALLSFTREDQELTIIITAGDGATNIHIVLSRPQK